MAPVKPEAFSEFIENKNWDARPHQEKGEKPDKPQTVFSRAANHKHVVSFSEAQQQAETSLGPFGIENVAKEEAGAMVFRQQVECDSLKDAGNLSKDAFRDSGRSRANHKTKMGGLPGSLAEGKHGFSLLTDMRAHVRDSIPI